LHHDHTPSPLAGSGSLHVVQAWCALVIWRCSYVCLGAALADVLASKHYQKSSFSCNILLT
jgi:hypothetical protein